MRITACFTAYDKEMTNSRHNIRNGLVKDSPARSRGATRFKIVAVIGMVSTTGLPASGNRFSLGKCRNLHAKREDAKDVDQPFLPMALSKTQRVRRMIEQVDPSCELELDGGIDTTTAPLEVAAGADVSVVGSPAILRRWAFETTPLEV
jgi:hypothetical protein